LNTSELILEAGRTERHYWRDLWRTGAILSPCLRDVTVRYRQTIAGACMGNHSATAKHDHIDLHFWEGSRTTGSSWGTIRHHGVCGNAALAILCLSALSFKSKHRRQRELDFQDYFPRLIVPGSSIVVSIVDFFVACSSLAGLMSWLSLLADMAIACFTRA
jgi:lipopolysaccharide transport system permease protein